jgi:hypothetical protein
MHIGGEQVSRLDSVSNEVYSWPVTRGQDLGKGAEQKATSNNLPNRDRD